MKKSSSDVLLWLYNSVRERRKKILTGLLVLSAIVFVIVLFQLRYTGISMTNAASCGIEEHTHDDSCIPYSAVLPEEITGETLLAGLYVKDGDSFVQVDCTDVSELDTESVTYYISAYSCGLEEHAHEQLCYSDSSADVETEEDWLTTIPELTGVWADDLVAIAEEQLADEYTESIANFVLSDSGSKMGYTRYGAWYNTPYAQWNGTFVSFCLYYAGITEDYIPYASGANMFVNELSGDELYHIADGTCPERGSLIFFNLDEDADAERMGIVSAVDSEAGTVTVIEGDTFVSADSPDAVVAVNYSLSDTSIMSWYTIPEAPEKQLVSSGIMMFSASPLSDDGVSAASEDATPTSGPYNSFTSYVGGASYGTDSNSGATDTNIYYDSTLDAYLFKYFHLDFVISAANIESGTSAVNYNGESGYGFTYQLPEGFFVADELVKAEPYIGYDGNGKKSFTWNIVKNDDGTYRIDLIFLDSYVEQLPENSTDPTGFMEFNAYISEDNQIDEGLDQGDVKIEIPGNAPDIQVDSDKIVYPTTTDDYNHSSSVDTPHYDVTISKAGSYNSENSTLDYTITVVSHKGTPASDIVLSDTLTSGGVQIQGTIDPASITVTKQYYSCVDNGYGWHDDKSSDTVTYPVTDITKDCTLTEGTTNTDGTVTLFTAHLPAIEDSADTDDHYATKYVITYSVSIAELSSTETYSPSNEVTLENEEEDEYHEDINVSTSAPVTLNKNMLGKTVGADYNTDTAYWTITVNSEGLEDLTGYTLTDLMFPELITVTTTTNEIPAVDENGDPILDENGEQTTTTVTTSTITGGTENVSISPDNGYEWYVDENGNPAIRFTAVNGGENTQAYTIEYSTHIPSSWANDSIPNKASLGTTDGETLTADVSCYVYAEPVTKTLASVGTTTGGLTTLNWTSSFVLPEGGIPAGATVTDNINDTTNNQNPSSHYMTSAQTAAFISSLANLAPSGGTVFNDYYIYFTGTDMTLNEHNYPICYYYRYNAADGTWAKSTTDTWAQSKYLDATYESIGGLPDGLRFTQFVFYFPNGVSAETYGSGTVALNYATTANVGDITSEASYYNYLTNGSSSASAGYTYRVAIFKTDGYGNAGDTTTSNGTGVVTWNVKVSIPEGCTGSTPITVTDTLPAGVSLTSVKVENRNSMATATDSTALTFTNEVDWDTNQYVTVSGTYERDKVTDTTGARDVVTLTIDPTMLLSDNLDNFVLVYVCQIDGAADLEEDTTFSLTNDASVSWNGSVLGSDSHTQSITVMPGTAGQTQLKRVSFDTSTRIASYTVDINPTAADMNGDGEGGTLTLKDTLKYDPGTTGSYMQSVYLNRSSITLYYAQKDANGDIIYDENGNLVADTSREVTDWLWKYYTEDNIYDNYVYRVIEVTVPDNEALVLQYSYTADTQKHPEYGDYYAGFSNTFVAADGTYHSASVNTTIKDSGVSSGINSTITYTFYKVDESNPNGELLSGAEFTLYAHNGTEYVNTGVVYTTVDGQFSISMNDGKYDYTYNTAYYVVETKAPDGYMIPADAQPYYFYFSHLDENAYPVKMPENFTNSGSNIDLSHGSETIDVPNAANATELTIDKTWLDPDGNDITDTKTGSVEVILWQVASLVEPTKPESGGDSGESGGDSEQPSVTPGVSIALKAQSYSQTEFYNDFTSLAEGTKVTMEMYFSAYDSGFHYDYAGWGKSPVLTIDDASWNYTSHSASTTLLEGNTYNHYIYSYGYDTVTIDSATNIAGYFGADGFASAIVSTGSAPDNINDLIIENPFVVYIYLNAVEPETGGSGDSGETDVPEDVETTVGNVGEVYTTTAIKKYTLSSAKGWTVTASNLPLMGKETIDGVEQTVYYSYYVVETKVPNYNTTYSNLSGTEYTALNSGSITVTNQSTGAYELPETGAIGILAIALNGVLLTALPVTLWLSGKRRRTTPAA